MKPKQIIGLTCLLLAVVLWVADHGLSPWLRMSTATTRAASDRRLAITPQFRADPKSPCAMRRGGLSPPSP